MEHEDQPITNLTESLPVHDSDLARQSSPWMACIRAMQEQLPRVPLPVSPV